MYSDFKYSKFRHKRSPKETSKLMHSGRDETDLNQQNHQDNQPTEN
jgi:hypothetical protein